MVSHSITQGGKWARRIGGGALVLALVGLLVPTTTRAMVDDGNVEVIEIEGEAPFEPPDWSGHEGSGGSTPGGGGGSGGGPAPDPDQEPTEQGETPGRFLPEVGAKCHGLIVDPVLHDVPYGRYRKASKTLWKCCQRLKGRKDPSCVECAKKGTAPIDQPCRNGWYVQPKP
jgi:hypothetical protein